MTQPGFEQVTQALGALGLIPRGGFHPVPDDDLGAGTVVLVGNAGPELWQHFAPQAGGEDALDKWCRGTLTPLADRLGADIVFPFDGPPHPPFLQWARRGEGLSPSPIGPLIHPIFGLWHAYRCALIFDFVMDVPPPFTTNPCDDCADQPCLDSCPVNAFSEGAYDVPACVDHLRQPQGDDCLSLGCRARRACPIGRDYHYASAQAHLHMSAFVKSN